MSSNSHSFKSGQCYTAFIRHRDNDGSFVSGNRGKPRPVLIIQDPIDEKFYAFKVTSQVHKPYNQRYGYLVENWREAGFNKASIIKCGTDNRFEIDPDSLGFQFGELTEDDLKGFLTKRIQVKKLELQRERDNENDNGMER